MVVEITPALGQRRVIGAETVSAGPFHLFTQH